MAKTRKSARLKTRICVVCGTSFKARRIDAVYCSQACRMKVVRTKQKEAQNQITEALRVQSEGIKRQAMVFNTVMPAQGPINKFFIKVGKDLTQCQNSGGKRLWTDQDSWILLGRLWEAIYSEDSGNPLSILNANKITDNLIADFERRFECSFDDIKSTYSDVHPDFSDIKSKPPMILFASMKYSR